VPAPAERSLRRLAAQGLLGILLVLVAIPGYLSVERSRRPLALRLAGTAIVLAGCVRVVRGLRRALEEPGPAAFDAPATPVSAPELDGRFLRLRDDLVFSARSERYFDTILWPRLRALAADGSLTRPAPRRGRRGPSLPALEGLIAAIERRR
jgi:hypothetical protein